MLVTFFVLYAPAFAFNRQSYLYAIAFRRGVCRWSAAHTYLRRNHLTDQFYIINK